jgi:tRNA pseudouridine55 synthase
VTDGILLLDKPSGPSSNGVLNRVRRWADSRKVGHAGTLDPLASGLLPVLIGRATRLAPFLPLEPKQYRTTLRFGVDTDSGDAEGQVTRHTDPGSAAPPDWPELLATLKGEVTLPVPDFAAVKVRGRRLYKYARAGVPVTAPERSMAIRSITGDASGWPWVKLDVVCGTGTYIRSLATRLGQATGVGAHVVSLRRLRVGHWHVAEALPAGDLGTTVLPSAAFIPIDSALSLSSLALEDEQASRVVVGRPPERVCAAPAVRLVAGQRFTFKDSRGRLLAVARSQSDWSDSVSPPEFEFERVLVS